MVLVFLIPVLKYAGSKRVEGEIAVIVVDIGDPELETLLGFREVFKLSMPERLEKQLNLALSAGPETVISCQVESFPDDVVTNGYRMYEKWLNHLIEPEDIKKNLFVSVC